MRKTNPAPKRDAPGATWARKGITPQLVTISSGRAYVHTQLGSDSGMLLDRNQASGLGLSKKGNSVALKEKGKSMCREFDFAQWTVAAESRLHRSAHGYLPITLLLLLLIHYRLLSPPLLLIEIQPIKSRSWNPYGTHRKHLGTGISVCRERRAASGRSTSTCPVCCRELDEEDRGMPAAVSGRLLPRSISMASASHQHQQHQPQRTASLPVINIARLGDKDPAARALVVSDIARACRDRGCFQVVNHGVSKCVMNGALEAASEFFHMSAEHKEMFSSDDIRSPIRYDTSAKDGISKSRSFLKHYANPLEDWVNFWPTKPATYRKKMGKYAVEIQRLSVQLMGAIVQGLGLGPMYLQDKLIGGLEFMALNSYPQGSSLAGDTVGLAPHSDYGFITILLQSSPGLEVMHHQDDKWTPVPVIPGALHVHLGDHLEVLSNGRLQSLVHRAILNTDEARISIASIHGVAMDEKVDCAEELVDERHPKMYRESSFHDFLDFLPTNVKTYRRFVETLKIDRA